MNNRNSVSAAIQGALNPDHLDCFGRWIYGNSSSAEPGCSQAKNPKMCSDVIKQHIVIAMRNKTSKFRALVNVIHLIATIHFISTWMTNKMCTGKNLESLCTSTQEPSRVPQPVHGLRWRAQPVSRRPMYYLSDTVLQGLIRQKSIGLITPYCPRVVQSLFTFL